LNLDELLSSLPQSTLKGDAISLPDSVLRRVLNLARVRKSDVFCHLGCGDGRAVELAASEFSVKRSVGIEIDPRSSGKARRRIRHLPNAEIITGDIRKADISKATVLLFWFTEPALVDSMTKRFKKELRDGARVISVWAPLGLTLPDRVDFPFFVSKKPFRRARSIRQQIKAIYGNNCIDFTASWLLAERYIDALEVVPGDYRRFVNILQSMVIWINAWNMGVACEEEIPPPVETYVGILKTFFNVDLSGIIKEKK
jgi:trans-aconitate methyltransferase